MQYNSLDKTRNRSISVYVYVCTCICLHNPLTTHLSARRHTCNQGQILPKIVTKASTGQTTSGFIYFFITSSSPLPLRFLVLDSWLPPVSSLRASSLHCAGCVTPTPTFIFDGFYASNMQGWPALPLCAHATPAALSPPPPPPPASVPL